MTLTSPCFSLSYLRKHARTCHLHCSVFLTHSYDTCSPYNDLKESPDPEVERSSNLLHPVGYRDMDMTTHHLPRSSGLGWPLLVCFTQSCACISTELHAKGDLQRHKRGKKWHSHEKNPCKKHWLKTAIPEYNKFKNKCTVFTFHFDMKTTTLSLHNYKSITCKM